MASSFTPIPFHSAITIRLTKSNYLLWRAQLLPYLRSTKLLGFLDGSSPAPPKEIPVSSTPGDELITNPAYEWWLDKDQQVLSGLLSSMSEEILPDVVTAKTSKAVWDTLQRPICVELATTKKCDLSAVDYFRKVKGLATELVTADPDLADDEVITYLLASLGPDYDPFVTSVIIRDEALTLDVVYAHLMAFEACQLQHQATLQFNTNAVAHYVGCGSP
jgi:hypothetical protein